MDLHSNASCTASRIEISSYLLKHHKGHPEEILAVLAHEFGHWKMNHLYKGIPFDTLYMVIFGCFLVPFAHEPGVVASFGITQNSYVMTLAILGMVWGASVDWFSQLFFLYLSRRDEDEADKFAVEHGHGLGLRKGLIRNFGVNLDNIYCSTIDTIISSSHPTLL